MRLRGRVELVHRTADGRILRTVRGPNLVTTVGKNLAAQIISSSSSRPSHMALGSGTAAPLESNTVLASEIAGSRAVFTSNTVNANEITYRRLFTNSSGGAWSVAEVGIFNAGAGGTMLARFLCTPPATIQNGETLDVSWTIPLE